MADAQNKPSIPTTEKILLNILKKIQIQSAFSSSWLFIYFHFKLFDNSHELQPWIVVAPLAVTEV